MTEQDYLDEIERKSKEIQEAKRAIEDLKKPKLTLEHNAVYRMSSGMIMVASVIDGTWFLKEMLKNRQSQRASSDGDLVFEDGIYAVEKIGKLAVVPCGAEWDIAGSNGSFNEDSVHYSPESLTGKRL